MGKEAATFYKRLADLISSKRQIPNPAVMGWLRCRLSFASIRSAIMCIRGSRSSLHRPIYMDNVALVSQEGRVPPPRYIGTILCFCFGSLFLSRVKHHKLKYNYYLFIFIFLAPRWRAFCTLKGVPAVCIIEL